MEMQALVQNFSNQLKEAIEIGDRTELSAA